MRYALDTNTLIYFFKSMGRINDNLLAHAPGDILIPAVVLYEIETGLAKSNSPLKRRKQLSAFVGHQLPIDQSCFVLRRWA